MKCNNENCGMEMDDSEIKYVELVVGRRFLFWKRYQYSEVCKGCKAEWDSLSLKQRKGKIQ